VDTVIFVRHGESEFSVRGAMNGDPDVACPLTSMGREQAALLARTLAGERIDLCVTSEFERTKETADLVLAGRAAARLVLPELNDIRVGDFEGRPLVEYRAWAHSHSPTAHPPGGGESRRDSVRRYLRAYRAIHDRPEPSILAVTHGLPIRYVLNAAREQDPTPIVEQVPYAQPHRLSDEELARAIARLEAWVANPAWPRR
jgi:probable phosphoglycerate mutase